MPLTAPAPHPANNAGDPVLLHDRAGPVAVLTLNRPQQRNSLSEALIGALATELASIAADRTVRAVVIAANGPAFCAGHDLKELTAARAAPDRGRAAFERVMKDCAAMMQAIIALPQPAIAAVNGVATAAGCQLVASCDLAVASSEARFATPGVDIGLFCSTPMVALTRNVARKHAMEMLLTGNLVAAEDAQRMGLINRVVAPGTERDAAIELAQQIASKSALTVKIGKQAFYRQADMPLADAYRYAASVMVENMLARDAEEGIGAFVEKRTPTWEDR
jgi:enoyl-CoA hydratase/carnithine racemase